MQHSNVTLPILQQMRDTGQKIAMLTCYDASFAKLMNKCGVDVLLIGDSLGMVCQGQNTTIPVEMDHMIYHTKCVAAGNERALLLADLPFGTYGTPEKALENAAALLKAGAHAVKLEGESWTVPIVQLLTQRGIPVCAHIGLTPQSVHQLGGYRVQGKSTDAATRLTNAALALQEAGAGMVLLEAVPAALGKAITALLRVPTIGIGAGPDCSGQVLVSYDALGISPGNPARFVKNFMEKNIDVAQAIHAFVCEVKNANFPAAEHCY
jgi:3-methyl-2-oxobutanoate hydroxymethyltransferase